MRSSSSSAGSAPRRRPMSDLIGASDDLSRFSVATTTASSERSAGGRGAAAFLDAFRSCFAPADARSPETSLSDVDLDASHQHQPVIHRDVHGGLRAYVSTVG
ncbi:hypothetical protein VPH35_016135 [Triticum aestivum]|uniref:uncharacterized protein n=1 Tax=Triticum aestivum TaxID=4565 RepID=UPI001D00AC50|nr:uncharacterized protein LOC123172347 [Triticum aestivum]